METSLTVDKIKLKFDIDMAKIGFELTNTNGHICEFLNHVPDSNELVVYNKTLNKTIIYCDDGTCRDSSLTLVILAKENWLVILTDGTYRLYNTIEEAKKRIQSSFVNKLLTHTPVMVYVK